MELRFEEKVKANRWQSNVKEVRERVGVKVRSMEAFPHWVIILIVVIVLAKVGVLLARRFAIPAVPIQLLIGILLGPSLINLLGAQMIIGTWGSPSSNLPQSVLKVLAEIGLIQLMFLAGLQTDWNELKKKFRSSFSIGAWGFVLAAASVAVITRMFVERWSEALAISAILSASGFGISIYYFSEMKAFGTRVAAMVSGAAILGGLLAILLMIASQATNYAAAHGAFKMTIAVFWFLAKLVMLFAVAYFLTSRFLKLVAKTGFEKRPRQMLIGYLLLVAALYAWAAIHFGSFAAVGVASLGGALLGMSDFGFGEKIARRFGSTLGSLPIEVLFVVLGMEVNFKEVKSDIYFLVAVLLIIIVAKAVGSWMATRKHLDSFGERALIVLGTLPQGEIGILIAAYLFSRGQVNPSFFNVSIATVILLTMIPPVLMRIAPTEFGVETTRVQVAGSEEFGERWRRGHP
jgi:Kef-type K+ transport system membrane component KefB